jgi:SAM-dependent methyltransferase
MFFDMTTNTSRHDTWSSGDAYERYIGRWSRLVAPEFIRWLAVPKDSQWLDVGCGTGALSQTIIDLAKPKKVKGIDRSEDYVKSAQSRINSPKAEFQAGDAQALPVDSEMYDAVISGLVLNFVPQPHQMIAEMTRAARKNGVVGIYVWDYAGEMQLLRHFWDAAAALDPDAQRLDEGSRFSICQPDALGSLFRDAGLIDAETRPIDVPTNFENFDDYWMPFFGGQGPAAGYAMSLSEQRRTELRDRIYKSLPIAEDGSIPLVARAWAVKGIKPE